MNNYKRVAIFFAPASQSPLAKFGAQWLGWDVESATELRHPNLPNLPAPIANIVATPKKYGFHGTLKAPFRLNTTKSLDDLCDAIRHFSKHHPRFTIGNMQVSNIGSFVAITQNKPSAILNNFASLIVREFDQFRAPLSEEDIAKRRKSTLTPRQEELMLKWGYPYIFDQFRFHLTLTGKLDEKSAEAVKSVLAAHLSDILKDPLQVVDSCLYGEREDGKFEIIERFPLLG